MRFSVVPEAVRRFGEAVTDEHQRLARVADRLGAAALDPSDFGSYRRSTEVAASYQQALVQVIDHHRTGAQVLHDLASLLQHEVPRHVSAQDQRGADGLRQVSGRLHRPSSTP